MKSFICFFAVLLSANAVLAAPGRSEFLSNLGQGISKKADERYQSRWTISDWFETQRKTRLQDMWLAGNKSDDLYEFYVGGRTGVRTITTDGTESSIRPRATQTTGGAYATFVGLEGAYLDQVNASESAASSGAAPSSEDSYGWEGWFAFRPLGDSLQNSNLTLFYGLVFRDEYGGETLQSSAAKARLTIYLTKAFGLEGQYQWNFKEKSNLGADLEGTAVEASVFLDFSLVRIFGSWTSESRTRTPSGGSSVSERKRQSVDVGLKIFF